MPRNPKATLHDVAARARVSIATVSRALNGLPVSQGNQERVHKAAEELGYVANEAARALRSERSQTMGLIFYDLRTRLGIELLDSLSEAIEDAGYALLISTARGDARRFELLMRRFLERRVDALFCIHAQGEGEVLARYHAAGVPVLGLITSAGKFADLPLIGPSIAEASDALARHLASLGHARVALVRQRAFQPQSATIIKALEARSLCVETLAPSEVGGMSEVLLGLMAKPERPTAVIAPRAHAHALLTVCDTAGIRVPDDLSIVRLGGPLSHGPGAALQPSGGRDTDRALSYLAIDPHRLGRAAGGAMLGWLAGVQPVSRLRVENANFVARATTGPAPKRG
jgi:LacI family transcriptional regulator